MKISVTVSKLRSPLAALLVVVASLSLLPQLASAGEEQPKQAAIEEASKQIVQQFKKEVTEKTPKPFVSVLKAMTSDDKFSFKLTSAIGTKSKKEASILLTKASETSMNVDYVDVGDEILQFKLCASINGVRHCFPSQRNSMKCPKF